jgi:uncharacterized protein
MPQRRAAVRHSVPTRVRSLDGARGRPARRLAPWLLWLLPILWSAAAAAAGADTGAAAHSTPGHGFLWEARKAERHALLMGTLHVGLAEDYPPPNPATRQRLSSVDVIALEADVSQADRSAAALLMRAQLAPEQPGLDTRIDPELKANTQHVLALFGVPAASAWRMKPWMLADTLVVLQAGSLGFSPAYSTEAYLASLAGSRGKPIAELEGIEAQLALLDAPAWDEQIDALRQTVRAILDGQAERELRALVAAWRGSDAAAMLDYLQSVRHSPDPAERKQFERLITARNASMADKIDRLLQDGRFYLVAVGSLHFFGSDGLLQQLEARGYTITPLPP